jgi:membrane-associated phospholipid phosphatase
LIFSKRCGSAVRIQTRGVLASALSMSLWLGTSAAYAEPLAAPGATSASADERDSELSAPSIFDPLNVPPAGESPPVPTPSPVVLAGSPTKPDRVGRPLEWHWRRFSTADWVITATGAGLTLATSIIPPRATHVSGPILFDTAARDALRAPSLQARYTYRDASDVGLSLMATWPFFADSLVSAWWYRGSRDVAEQMALINLQALAVSGAVQGVTNTLVSRERPYGQNCGTRDLPSDAVDCDGSTHFRSFFSGHSAFSFTSAALICMNHMKHELLGSPWDALSCAGGYAVATTTATFRVVGDVHYASDVITGALLGTVIGYGIPLLHYSGANIGSVHAGSVNMQIVPSGTGAGVVGTF